MSKSIESTKKESEEKIKPAPAPAQEKKKAIKRKDLKEGIEVKDDGVYFDLNSKKKVCVKRFKSSILVDIRSYFTKDEECFPTKKGVALSVESWNKLKDFINDIDDAVDNA